MWGLGSWHKLQMLIGQKTAKRNLGMWGTPFVAKIGAVAKTATILKYHQRGARKHAPLISCAVGMGLRGWNQAVLALRSYLNC